MYQPVLNAFKYGYAHARVCSMKSLLLPKQFILNLTKVNTVDEVIELLERTHYRDMLLSYSQKYSGSMLVQVATLQYFSNIITKIKRMIPLDEKEVYYLVMIRWHVANVKMLLNARMKKRKWDEVKDFYLPIATMEQDLAKQIVEEEGHKAFKAFSSSWFGRLFFKHRFSPSTVESIFINAEKKPEVLADLKVLLDKFQYSICKHELFQRPDLKKFITVLRKEIDIVNITTIGKMKWHGLKVDESKLLPYGMLSDKELSTLIRDDMDEFIDHVSSIFHVKSEKDLMLLEVELRRYLAIERLRAFYHAPLSLSSVISFPFLQEELVHNLRKIAVAKEFNVESDRIRRVLVL